MVLTEELQDISSTLVRQAVHANDMAKLCEYVDPNVLASFRTVFLIFLRLHLILLTKWHHFGRSGNKKCCVTQVSTNFATNILFKLLILLYKNLIVFIRLQLISWFR